MEPGPRPRHVAVFGDTHGHLRLMFQLCRLWQLDSGVHLDGVLQCGDLGFFPDPGRVDRATRKLAKRDPEELAFGAVNAGCVAVLRWRDTNDHGLHVLDDPWIARVTGHGWHHL